MEEYKNEYKIDRCRSSHMFRANSGLKRVKTYRELIENLSDSMKCILKSILAFLVFTEVKCVVF